MQDVTIEELSPVKAYRLFSKQDESFSVEYNDKLMKGQIISRIKQMNSPIFTLFNKVRMYLTKYFLIRNSYSGIPVRITSTVTCSGFITSNAVVHHVGHPTFCSMY